MCCVEIDMSVGGGISCYHMLHISSNAVWDNKAFGVFYKALHCSYEQPPSTISEALMALKNVDTTHKSLQLKLQLNVAFSIMAVCDL